MKKITIGVVDGSKEKVSIDLASLKQTRLLITADSGGGKTYLMKKIVEEAFGKLSIHIIDPEGEFAPLRELFDFFLIAKGGDTAPDIRFARSQAQTFLKLRASVICDIYELRPNERIAWVKEYVEGLVEAPKDTRHPCLVMIDEAHLFAPEKATVASSLAMADIASRGRKRGLIIVLATQRLSKLSKDVSSELRNRLIGPTFEDVNRERAADTLGITKSGKEAFYEQIRLLDAGHFFALGRAISKKLIVVKVGKIRSKHGEEAEKFMRTPPPARGKIAAMMKKLTELPREQEERDDNLKSLRERIRDLTRDVQTYKHEAQRISIPTGDPKKTKEAVKREAAKIRDEYDRFTLATRKALKVIFNEGAVVVKEMKFMSDQFAIDLRRLADRVDVVIGKGAKKIDVKTPKIAVDQASETGKAVVDMAKAASVHVHATPAVVKSIKEHIGKPGRIVGDLPHNHTISTNGGDASRPKAERAILRSLADIFAIGDPRPSKAKVAFFAGMSGSSSSYTSAIAKLVREGAIKYEGDGLAIGAAERQKIDTTPISRATVDQMISKIFSGSARSILETVRSVYPASMMKSDLAQAVGASPKSSTFTSNLGDLRKAGFIDYDGGGAVKMESWLDLA